MFPAALLRRMSIFSLRKALLMLSVIAWVLVGCVPLPAPTPTTVPKSQPTAARPPNTPIPSMTLPPAPSATFTAAPTATATLKPTDAPTATTKPTSTPMLSPTQTSKPTLAPTRLMDTNITASTSLPPTQTSSGRIVASIQKYDYSQWGRPAGMDDPAKPCGDFDDRRPVRKLTASLHIENRSNQEMTDWYALIYKTNGAMAYTCYQGYSEGFPSIPPGQSRDVTFSAFFEINERISYAVVADSKLGESNRLTFP